VRISALTSVKPTIGPVDESSAGRTSFCPRAGFGRAVGSFGNVAGASDMNGCGSSSRSQNIMKTLLKNLISDDQGGEVLEYALIAGLIVVAAIAVITSVGTKVVAKWQSVDNGL
jgi:Flp pilus assembly pilin Flp